MPGFPLRHSVNQKEYFLWKADFLLLEYGKGFYLLTTLDTRSQGNVDINKPMFENIMQFLVDQRKQRMAIIPAGKLVYTWGRLKAGD
jgi:hypothetical protein